MNNNTLIWNLNKKKGLNQLLLPELGKSFFSTTLKLIITYNIYDVNKNIKKFM